jgi:hypothetical protein
MTDEIVFEKAVDLNSGHDNCLVVASIGYGSVVEMSFNGRDPTTVVVHLIEMEDVRSLGQALIDAAAAVEARRT